MEKYPRADGLERAVRTVLPGLTVDAGNDTAVAEDYHAVCAYGVTAYKLRMWKPILYYDTYAPHPLPPRDCGLQWYSMRWRLGIILPTRVGCSWLLP
jgi:hypothetical protein